MAQFTVSIPGIGDIVIDGPFATEDSIRTLTNAISRSRNTGGGTRDDDDLDDIFDDLIGASNDASDSMDRLIRQTNRSRDSFGKLSNGLDRSVNGLKNLVAGSNEFNGGLGKMVETFGESSASLISTLPGVGTVAGGVITAFTGLIAAAIGFVQGLEETNTALMSTGALFKGGIDEFQRAASDGGIAMSSLTKSITENNASYRMLSGGLVGGSKTITKSFKTMGTEQQRLLYSMGYSTDEILSGMADFAAMAKLSGKDLSMEEIAKGGADYLKVQRELTRLTGKSADQLKQQRDELRGRAEFQNFLNRIGDPKLRESVENGMLAIPEAAQDMITRMTRGIQFTDPAMARIMETMPDLEREFRALGAAARDGTISSSEYTARYNNAMGEFTRRNQEYIDQQGADLQLQRQYNQVIDQEMTMREQLATYSVGFNEALKSSTTAMDIFNGPEGVLSKALGVFKDYDNRISSIMQDFGASVAKIFTPKGKFTEILDSLIIFGKDVSSMIDKWASGDATFGEMWGKVYESFKNNFGDIFNTTTGILKDMLDGLSNAIANGIEKGINQILNGIGYETESKEQSDAAAEIAKLPEQLQKFIKDPADLSVEERSKLTPADLAQLQKVYDLMWEVDNLEKMGYRQEGSKLLGTERYIQLSPDQLKAGEAKIPDPTMPGVQLDPNSINNFALGGMFEPKQGGHIIRVAEALSPEIVAPAKRTSDGKLGLEVSGVMLDNSRLLQNLLKVNEGQAALMAGLNSKIDGMNSTFEKLVYEQRQANRLAV